MSEYHESVLRNEAIDYLRIEKDERYIDGTFGGGGHSLEILKRGGRVLGIDVDQEAIEYGREKFKVQSSKFKDNIELVRGNFGEIAEIARSHNFLDVAGILLDLGVSSHQLDTPERGFTFSDGGPLDMRMDDRLSLKAGDLVNGMTHKELALLFEKYGEERHARLIAKIIVEEREKKPFETTRDLADAIRARIYGQTKIHPATRVFQALRIAVNDELFILENALPEAFSLLKPGGRLVVITFHSLEDRIVKHTFEKLGVEKRGQVITKKPVIPTDTEVAKNRRARSAKMRVIERS